MVFAITQTITDNLRLSKSLLLYDIRENATCNNKKQNNYGGGNSSHATRASVSLAEEIEMKRVIVYSGVSGSGKSTHAAKSGATVVSADTYFEDKFGRYHFDPRELSEAHAYCFRYFITLMEHKKDELIAVDNTATTVVEVAPYILGAEAFGYHVCIRTLMCKNEAEVYACAARNSHQVPPDAVMAQHRRLQSRRLQPWWQNTFFPIEGV